MNSLERPRILVVDDEPDFRTSLTDILESRGYECITASSVQEGADQVRSHQPNLCLVDLRLPDGTGLDLLSRIREASPGSETIVLTGYASLPTAVKAMSLGAFGYLEKPYNVDRLFLTIEKALERQRLIQTVERSENAYSGLLNATGAAIFSLTPITWHIGNVNSAFTKLLGYSSEEAEQLTLEQLLTESERTPVVKVLTELSSSRPELTRNLTFEAPLRHKNGTPNWFSINATRIVEKGVGDQGAVKSEECRVTSVRNFGDSSLITHHSSLASPDTRHPSSRVELLLVCTDVAASRRALAELEQTKSFVEGVFAALPCGVVIVDSDFHIIDANSAWCKPLGLGRAEAQGRRCHDAFSHYTSPCSMFGELCPITAARTTGTVGRVYREHRLPDGRVRNLEYTANPLLDEHGSITAFVVVANDLTDLREVEERLHQAKLELEKLNADLRAHHEELKANARRLEKTNVELLKLSNAKSEFVATVSHELRTPLTAISEGIGLVEDGSLGALNDDQHTFLNLAGKNTKRLTDLINDLLDLSKIEAGKMEVHRRRLDLRRIAREVAATYDSIAREQHVMLKVDLPKDLEPVLADEQSVLRILTNLVGNAIKFTPSGGGITITAGRDGKWTGDGRPETGLRSSVPGPQIAVSVSDTGVGIPRDQQHRLFGKFEQVNQPGALRPQGTGLGLALTRQMVELNEGRIWLESEEGKGSRFSFTLPVYTEFAGFAADLRNFASVAANSRNGTPVIYCFRVQPEEGSTGSSEPGVQGSTAASEVLPDLEELLDSLFPMPRTLSVISSGWAILVLAPRKVPEDKLQFILESLKGASLFVGEQEFNARLQFGALDYDQFKLEFQALTAGPSESETDSASRLWDALYDELKPRLKEIR